MIVRLMITQCLVHHIIMPEEDRVGAWGRMFKGGNVGTLWARRSKLIFLFHSFQRSPHPALHPMQAQRTLRGCVSASLPALEESEALKG